MTKIAFSDKLFAMSLVNAISVDVEEYFHAENLQKFIGGRKKWNTMSSRLEVSIDKVLEIFSKKSIKASFFILGSLARKHPSILRKIAEQGHELGSHGYNHKLVYQQSPKK